MAPVPFAFLPRVVSKRAKPWQGISSFSPSPSPSPEPTTDPEPEDSASENAVSEDEPSSGKGKEKAVEQARSNQSALTQDIASLISLGLSNYNIWHDADLRGKLDAYLSNDVPPGEAGYVPINYLVRRVPFRGSLPCTGGARPEPSEADVVKALRTHASDVLDVRMRLPSSSVWYGTGKTSRKKDIGGYEVRRKDWPSLLAHPSRGWTHARWDDLTTYLEGIPPQYRTVGGIVRFVEMLLAPETDAETPVAVQHVFLPPHYLDRPGDTPKCKGHALVTLSSKPHAEALRRAWPWKRVPTIDDALQIVKEAHKYGFRTISKARWDAFNEEYLLYKQSLVDIIAQAQTHTDVTIAKNEALDKLRRGDEDESEMRRPTTTPTSLYPFDCLVFVRNIHPETNKTTLKTLFGRALQDDLAAALDYVDFTKGMDTCHLRLASPDYATRLVAFFDARGIAQVDGLDAVGRTPVHDDKPITIEMVQGKKEELYWERVPERVRRQAVDKAVKAISADLTAHTNHSGGHKKRRREP